MVPEERYDVMRAQVNKFSLILAVLACVQFFVYLIMHSFMGRAGEKLESKIKYTIFRHLLRMDIEFYDSGKEGSEAVALMLLQDASTLRSFGGSAVGQILTSVITMLVGVFVALSADWRLGLVCAACMSIFVASGFLRFKVQSRFQNRIRKAYEASGTYAGEIVTCIKAVNSLTREKNILQRYYGEIENQVQQSRSHTLRTAAFYAIAQVVSPFCISIDFWYASVLLLKQEVDMYQFYVSLMAVITGSMAVQSIFSFAPEINLAKKCTANMARLLDCIPEIDECSREGLMITASTGMPAYGGTQNPVQGTIELRDISFRYPFEPEMAVLRGVTMKVAAGEYAAIVSAGNSHERSAIIELIEQFYRPSGGSIVMDAWDISELNIATYRYQLGYVSAKASILEEVSIMENILLGLSDSDLASMPCQKRQEEVIRACRKAHIHDFIMSLPSGYDTLNGILYSPSQRFRLALARAIVRDPKILLIDNIGWVDSPVSASELQVIRRAIDSAAQGRTTVLVTNELALTESADLIFVMDEGKIVESGYRHNVLLRKGQYSQMMEQVDLNG